MLQVFFGHRHYDYRKCPTIIVCHDFRTVHMQIKPRQQTHDGHTFPDRGQDDLNVMVIQLESVSRLSFLRHAPDLHQYLTHDLGGVLIDGYSKVILSKPLIFMMLFILCKTYHFLKSQNIYKVGIKKCSRNIDLSPVKLELGGDFSTLLKISPKYNM